MHVWVATTDAGGDEKKARAMFLAKTQSNPNCLFFEIDCLAHQYQLMVLASLAHGEELFKNVLESSFPYYGSLSKLMIVWREHARDIFELWAIMHGATSAIKFARRIPPKCIRGRWGSVSRCEDFALAPATAELLSVLTSLATACESKKSYKKRPSSTLDEAEAEE
jgi:hypothetical protein